MNDTPRTDQKHEVICESWSNSVSSFPEMTEFARQLERELSEVTKQRDTLAEALRKLADCDWVIAPSVKSVIRMWVEECEANDQGQPRAQMT